MEKWGFTRGGWVVKKPVGKSGDLWEKSVGNVLGNVESGFSTKFCVWNTHGFARRFPQKWWGISTSVLAIDFLLDFFDLVA